MYGTTAKFKSANIFISAAQDQTAKFKDRQYFRLYGNYSYGIYIGMLTSFYNYLIGTFMTPSQ